MKILPARTLLFSLLFAVTGTACKRDSEWTAGDPALKDSWQIQSSAKVRAADSAVSLPDFNPQDWYAATVPGSILGSLVADSIYKNVFFGRNLEKIPDSLFDVPWWYRTTFEMDPLKKGQVTRLQFNGINYRADVWLNGRKIASSDTLKGGFCRFTLDVSEAVREGKNVLAVKVARPGPGEPTLGFVDWNPAPPDHNMGIWRDVQLKISGPVSIDEPFVQTKVDTATLGHADLTVSALLNNHSDKTVKGELKGSIGDISFSQPVTLPPHTSKEAVFSPSQYAQLSMDHPWLWWTHTWGAPYLYNLHLAFTAGDAVSDSGHTRFGIRSVSEYTTPEGHRGYKLNGKKILIRGGGWTDPMLLNASPAYEQAGIDYAVQMNLNAIRMEGFWGHDQHLYDLCDEKGILVMVGWSAQWEWEGVFGTPDDEFGGVKSPEQMAVAARSWKDQVTWLRNHPSIFLWLYGSDKLPRPALEKQYLSILEQYDPTRPYAASAKEHTSSLTGATRVKMRGPYDYVPPVYWYVDTAYGGAFGFNTETGPGPQVPVLESLRKMIPADSLWPIGSAWLYHAARGNFHNLAAYNKAMDNRLGKAANLRDYLRKAQYLNYEGMRAMFEAFASHRFRATGIIQWMYNASWPKLWWQLYDYYLMPTAAFYGARKANEPVHISYNYGDNSVEAMNSTLQKTDPLRATIRVLDFNLHPVFTKEVPLSSLSPQETATILRLPDNLRLPTTFFLDLRLEKGGRRVVSRNFYVLSTQKDQLDEGASTWYITPETRYADLKMLQQLPGVMLDVRRETEQRGDTTFVRVTLKNPAAHLAFMIHLDLKKGKSGASVLPVFWEDNYFSLLPDETITVWGYCHTSDLQGQEAVVAVDGWNLMNGALKMKNGN